MARIAVTGGAEGRAGRRPGPAGARPPGAERRPGPVGRVGRPTRRRRSCAPTSPTSARPWRPSPGPRSSRDRGGRPPGRHPLAGPRHPRHRVPVNVTSTHRVRGRGPPAPGAGGLGVQRDHPRPAVRPPARLRPGGRAARAAPGDLLCPVQGPRRGDGPPVPPLDRDPVPRAALLQHHGAGRLPAVPDLLGRPEAAQVEPVGLCRRVACGPGRAPGPGGRRRRGRGVHHRRRRHRHAPPQPRPDGRGLPGVPVKDDLAEHGTLLGIGKAAGCSATTPSSPGDRCSAR